MIFLPLILSTAWILGLMTATILGIRVAERRNERDGFAVGIVLALVGPITFLAVVAWAFYHCGRLLINLARAAFTPKNPKENASS